MKAFNCIILSFMSVSLMVLIGCADMDTAVDSTKEFHPEYDYMIGYDVFPNGYTYAASAFDNGNVNFSPTESHSDIPPTFLDDMADVFYFINQHSDCYEYIDGECKKKNGLNKLWYGAYLTAIQDLTVKPANSYLGMTLFGGQKLTTYAFIFVQLNRDVSDNWPYNAEQFVQATVVHELGHAIGNLTHLCNGPNRNSTYHNSGRCVMTNQIPWPECRGDDDVSPLQFGPSFCGKCSSNLKKIEW